MKMYSIQGLSASGTGPATAGAIIGATTVRPMLRRLNIGFRTAPNSTDQQIRVALSNFTAVGTAGSSPTPKAQDPSDPIAAQCTAGITHSGEPTLGANFIDTDLNQRASKEWIWEDGKEVVGAATASNGLSSRMVASVAAIVMSAPMAWVE